MATGGMASCALCCSSSWWPTVQGRRGQGGWRQGGWRAVRSAAAAVGGQQCKAGADRGDGDRGDGELCALLQQQLVANSARQARTGGMATGGMASCALCCSSSWWPTVQG